LELATFWTARWICRYFEKRGTCWDGSTGGITFVNLDPGTEAPDNSMSLPLLQVAGLDMGGINMLKTTRWRKYMCQQRRRNCWGQQSDLFFSKPHVCSVTHSSYQHSTL